MTNERMIRISRLRLLELRTWNGYSLVRGSILDPICLPKALLPSGPHYFTPIAKASVT